MEDCDIDLVKEDIKNRFLAILSVLLPPCCGSLPVKEEKDGDESDGCDVDNENDNDHKIECGENNFLVSLFTWPSDYHVSLHNEASTVEILTLLLVNELSVGGQLFNVCVDVFARQDFHCHYFILVLLKSTLFAVLTNYKCLAEHSTCDACSESGTTSLSLHEHICTLTSVLRGAAEMAALSETWWKTGAGVEENTELKEPLNPQTPVSLSLDVVEDAVQGMCAFVVDVAQKVALEQKGEGISFLSHHCVPSRKRQRGERGKTKKLTGVQEKWFAVTYNGSFLQLQHTSGIAEALYAENRFMMDRVESNERNVHKEALSEVGSVLATVGELCEARTLPATSAWQYGRNRITLASVTVIVGQVSVDDKNSLVENSSTVMKSINAADDDDKKKDKVNDCGNLLDEVVTNKNGTQVFLGYFLHETATLNTSSGGRYIMETD